MTYNAYWAYLGWSCVNSDSFGFAGVDKVVGKQVTVATSAEVVVGEGVESVILFFGAKIFQFKLRVYIKSIYCSIL